MKTSELKELKAGSDITHKRYGVCEIRDIQYSLGSFFGLIIRPKTDQGRKLLQLDSQTDISDYLEDSLRSLSVTSIP